MLTEQAEVLSVSGQRAIVLTQRNEACHSCQAQGACKVMGGGKETRVEVLNYIHAQAGDRVELALPEDVFLKASMATYLVPLVALLGGAVLGQALAGQLGLSANAASAIFAITAVGLSIPLIARLNKNLGGREEYIPRIVKVLPPASTDMTDGQAEDKACRN
ncbi:MAG: SoxR reducing system RseC family protein [Pseudomonadota bacterium]